MKDKTIVVSGVNIRKGGTLTIMRDCLRFLSENLGRENRIVAVVHDRNLTPFADIEFIECPDSTRSWGRRLKTEYVGMRHMAKEIGHVDLWLSLHDTTPNVEADVQAVYCQTSFPFLKWHLRDGLFDKKIPLFALFTRFAYRINVHRNRYLIVQQRWLREKLSRLLGVDRGKFIVFPPQKYFPVIPDGKPNEVKTFSFVSTPDCHKNFETLCEAARLLEKRVGRGRFRVVLTISGKENRYSRWLLKRWGDVSSIEFRGFVNQPELIDLYSSTDCLVFPSRVETWGLPVTEFMQTGRPLILADLPYAHETSAGADKVAFFPAEDARALSRKMESFINGDFTIFSPNSKNDAGDDCVSVTDWGSLFEKLLNDNKVI